MYFYITRWNHAGFTAPVMVPAEVAICEAGRSQQQNRLLLRSESDVPGHNIIVFTTSHLPKGGKRECPDPGFLVTRLIWAQAADTAGRALGWNHRHKYHSSHYSVMLFPLFL